jgi:hypothetical protein
MGIDMAETDRKYPRTYHLPSSPGLQNDDRRLPDVGVFSGRRVIATEKIDGEGATMTRDRTYPRSPDGRYHPSRDLMKAYHARRALHIPDLWRICGEYAHALHSVPYLRSLGNALPDVFLGFAAFDARNVMLSWDETLEVFEMLDVHPVPVLYDGPWHDRLVDEIAASIDPTLQEGFVVRLADEIPYPDGIGDQGRFFRTVAKWVRAGHVQTDEHWMSKPVVPNEIQETEDER